MAVIGTIQKKVNKPLRMMGAKSTTVEGPILYYEFGTFTIANGASSGTLATDLTNVIGMILTPMNQYCATAEPYSTLIVTATGITVLNTDPGNAAGAAYSYLLIGTVETV